MQKFLDSGRAALKVTVSRGQFQLARPIAASESTAPFRWRHSHSSQRRGLGVWRGERIDWSRLTLARTALLRVCGSRTAQTPPCQCASCKTVARRTPSQASFARICHNCSRCRTRSQCKRTLTEEGSSAAAWKRRGAERLIFHDCTKAVDVRPVLPDETTHVRATTFGRFRLSAYCHRATCSGRALLYTLTLGATKVYMQSYINLTAAAARSGNGKLHRKLPEGEARTQEASSTDGCFRQKDELTVYIYIAHKPNTCTREDGTWLPLAFVDRLPQLLSCLPPSSATDILAVSSYQLKQGWTPTTLLAWQQGWTTTICLAWWS